MPIEMVSSVAMNWKILGDYELNKAGYWDCCHYVSSSLWDELDLLFFSISRTSNKENAKLLRNTAIGQTSLMSSNPNGNTHSEFENMKCFWLQVTRDGASLAAGSSSFRTACTWQMSSLHNISTTTKNFGLSLIEMHL